MSRTFYVRCVEADGSDYLYQTCSSIEEARAVLAKQNPDDVLYEHLYIVDQEIPDISSDDKINNQYSKLKDN